MSDLHGLGAPGVAGDPALPPPPDDSLLREFLQVRALAQHVNVMARLDAFAAAHDAATAEVPDGAGIRVRWGAKDDDQQDGEGSANSNTILAGHAQSKIAQSLFDATCGGGNCHSAPSAPPPPPIPYFQNQEDGSGQSNPTPVYIDPNKYSESAGHAQDAQAAGAPSTLTIDRPGAGGRRRDALSGNPPQPGLDRDEYPPAVTGQGGSGASVRPISPSDNRGAGASVGQQITNVPDGGKIQIIISPRPAEQ